MRISAKADYAVRAALELAASPEGEPVKGEQLADSQEIPLQFLEHILLELKHARLIQARRGAKGGYWLAREPASITVADVIRAVEGPLANIHENAPEDLHYGGPADQAARRLGRGPRGASLGARERHARRHRPGQPAVANRRDSQRPRGLDQALTPGPAYSGRGGRRCGLERC